MVGLPIPYLSADNRLTEQPVSRVSRIVFAVLTCAPLAFAASACSGSAATPGGPGGGRGRGAGGPQPVVMAKVGQKDVPLDIAAVGNVEAFTLITVRSQITGQ